MLQLPSEDQLVGIKLSNNQDLITFESGVDEKERRILNYPMVVFMAPTEDPTKAKAGIGPWVPFSKDGKVPLERSAALAAFEPTDRVKEMYLSTLRRMTSPIVTPPEKTSRLIMP